MCCGGGHFCLVLGLDQSSGLKSFVDSKTFIGYAQDVAPSSLGPDRPYEQPDKNAGPNWGPPSSLKAQKGP